MIPSSAPTAPRPDSTRPDTPGRIIGFDLARAWAIVGMVAVNYKLVVAAEDREPLWLARAVESLQGRAVATFVVLAGIGMSLLSARTRQSGDPALLTRDRNTLLRRALFLFGTGLLFVPIWPADILHFYGLYIGVAAFLLAAPSRRLWGLAGGLVATFVVLLLLLDYERGWNFDTLEYSGFWTPDGMARHLFFNGFHPVIPWLAFLLVGLALGRARWSDPVVRRKIFGMGVAVAALAEATSWLLIRVLATGASAADREIIVAVFGTAPMPPVPLYMLAGGGVACAVIAAAVEIGTRFPNAVFLRPFIATGQLALTLYAAHVVVGLGVLDAMGRLQNQSLIFAMTSTTVFCAGGVIFATLWRRWFRRGPLEALMRRLTDPRARR